MVRGGVLEQVIDDAILDRSVRFLRRQCGYNVPRRDAAGGSEALDFKAQGEESLDDFTRGQVKAAPQAFRGPAQRRETMFQEIV